MATQTPTRTPKLLREFGLTSGAIVALLFGVLLPLIFGHGYPAWPWVVALILGAAGLLIPQALGPVYRAWMAFGHLVGWINTRLLLGITFYLLVLPVGMIMRLFGHDPMRRKLEPEAGSYRTKCDEQPTEHFERPF